MLCTDFGEWGESTIKLLLKIAIMIQNLSVSFVSLRRPRVPLQNNTFRLRKVVENHCDMVRPTKSFDRPRGKTEKCKGKQAENFFDHTL